ncbi:hypothetical protein [Xylophilus sp. GOD-11R]|uniref:hypothetical protein n=1 Tax=Xylophilus sp. GOD-11R TaxID=3089814 RepID=UPI00298C6B83|nr:hypothetical protein [Xylophilus sp. GOD-11R]WPB58212.1 hypothetical protein R9X41_06110 [Xylophilus sp. GOD-11R]
MKTNSPRMRGLISAIALAAASLTLPAMAQTTTTTTTDSTVKTEPAKGTGPVQRAEDATVRGAKRAGHATANAGRKSAAAVRHTGEKIGSKLPPGPNDPKPAN